MLILRMLIQMFDSEGFNFFLAFLTVTAWVIVLLYLLIDDFSIVDFLNIFDFNIFKFEVF